MSRLKQLIDKLCPNGVEYKTLGGISNKIIDGSHNPPKKGIGNKLYPMISAKNINNGKIDFIDARMISKEDFEIENKRTQVTQNDLLITIVGAIGRVAVVETEMNVVFQRSVCVIKVKHEKINSKFLKYVLESNVIQSKILRMANGAAQKGIYLNQVEKIKIPVPPLEVQNEIVRLLDNFTELTAELTAELLKRKQQYQYYRDLLLNFENDINISDKSSVKRLIRELCPNGVEYKTLGKIADVTKLAGFEFTQYVNYADKGKIIALRGLNVKNGNLDLSEVKYIDDSDFNKLSRSKLYINDMLFTYVGTVGEVALVDENDRYYLAPNVARIRFLNENVNPVFMRYYFQTHQFIKSQLDKYMAMSSMKNLTMEKIRKFKVPLPPLEVQNKIVEILDRFNTLANDITCGLPAEIELQQKRYEYFRDLLLTFDDSLSDNAQGLKGSRAQGLKGSRAQGLKGSRAQGLKGSRAQGLKGSRAQGLE